MSYSSPSFQLLDSAQESRADQIGSLRRNFILLVVILIVLGMLAGMVLFGVVKLHQFNWTMGLIVLSNAFAALALTRVIYRRLPR